MNIHSKTLARIGLIAALYVVITIVLHPISYSNIQVRLSEILTLLPFFMGYPAAIGLWIGCMIANIFGGLGLIDIIFGSLITLIAGLFTARASSLYEASIYPIVFNAFGVALILKITSDLPYLWTALSVGLGQFIAIFVIGIPIMKLLNKKIDLKEY